jgi:hypothetical protein
MRPRGLVLVVASLRARYEFVEQPRALRTVMRPRHGGVAVA